MTVLLIVSVPDPKINPEWHAKLGFFSTREMKIARFKSRNGFTVIELMLVIVMGCMFVALIAGGWFLWTRVVEVGRNNRAYDAVAVARYTDPELIETYDSAPDAHCAAKDDVIGFHLRATDKSGARQDLTVCCGSTLSTKPCSITVDPTQAGK